MRVGDFMQQANRLIAAEIANRQERGRAGQSYRGARRTVASRLYRLHKTTPEPDPKPNKLGLFTRLAWSRQKKRGKPQA